MCCVAARIVVGTTVTQCSAVVTLVCVGCAFDTCRSINNRVATVLLTH